MQTYNQCCGSGSVSYSNGTEKLKGSENLTKNTFCAGPVGPIDKENRVKMCKKYCFRYIPLWNSKDPDPDPDQIEKPDPDQSEKQDPYPYQNGLDPQHCIYR
jgi:hypothetical protein